MAHKKLLVVTAGDALENFPAVLPQLVHFFAASQGQSAKLVDADPGDGSLHSIDGTCDRVKPGGSADRGRAIVEAYAETDILLFDVGRNAGNVAEVMPFLSSARMEAAAQGRLAIAFLPCAFEGSPAVIRTPQESEKLDADNFKVRFALASAARRVNHLRCGKSYTRMGSIPLLGSGLADLVRRDGPTLGAFLANTPDGYGFAANHIRAWLNKCIDGGVFDDVIPNDQVVPSWFQRESCYWAREALDYRYGHISVIDDAHDDELFKRYHPFWLSRRDVLAIAP